MKKIAHYQSLEYDRMSSLLAKWQAERDTSLSVLDFGCGHGKYLKLFSGIGCQVAGVDINPAYVDEARSAGFACYNDAEFFERDNDRYDVIVLSHLIEHLPPEALTPLLESLCHRLAEDGRLIVITPVPGENFYHDFSHIRPYLPQSIRHAFGQSGAPISYGEKKLIALSDIHFFKDPYKTRFWRSYYFGTGPRRFLSKCLNASFDMLWRATGGRIGITASWLGVYRLIPKD